MGQVVPLTKLTLAAFKKNLISLNQPEFIHRFLKWYVPDLTVTNTH